MQTILGSGGAIGVELAKVLRNYTDTIRLVSRTPEKVNPEDELISADLTNAEDVMKAVEGSEIVYITAGLPYSTKIWTTTWPVVMKNIIEACKKHNAKLVLFDNIYMYDGNHLNGMKEDTPINPPSKKGKVREEVSSLIINEFNRGEMKALIARSADFYGPLIKLL